ncbi:MULTISPECIES: hypothetical protein [Streptomyces]|uniref:Lipoprotein n=1 Tax=Streptomyces edwardsiae TaxID=3075527 RepID=A0ABU2QQQ5_9ACTN|nr:MULTISPECIES: hypothetical protein [unclassified Streptomyces]MDT0405800.1 hypothetical protein [Streptomyces sp. DSM 41635]
MRVTHRLTALAFGLVVLTGCDSGDDGQAAATTAPATSAAPSATTAGADPITAPATSAAPSATTAGADPTTGAEPTTAPATTAPWAGTKQFVQIKSARTGDGRTYLSVRPAQKKAHPQFEAWVIIPGKGAYTEVPMTKDATILLSVPLGDGKHPASYSQAELVTRVTAQSSSPALVGYDLSFDAEGRVTRLQSLYTP